MFLLKHWIPSPEQFPADSKRTVYFYNPTSWFNSLKIKILLTLPQFLQVLLLSFRSVFFIQGFSFLIHMLSIFLLFYKCKVAFVVIRWVILSRATSGTSYLNLNVTENRNRSRGICILFEVQCLRRVRNSWLKQWKENLGRYYWQVSLSRTEWFIVRIPLPDTCTAFQDSFFRK